LKQRLATFSREWHPAFVLVGLLLLLPLIAAVPLASPIPSVSITASAMYLYIVGLIVMIAAWIGRGDHWLGAFVAWIGVSLLWSTHLAWVEIGTIIMSAMALVILRSLPERHHGLVVGALVASGLFQVADGLQQLAGYDILFHGLNQIEPIPAMFGTTGNSNYLGVYLAMIAPLAPWWAVPIFLLGIFLSHSILGAVAVAAGLLWRVRQDKYLVAFLLSISVVIAGFVVIAKGSVPLSGFHHRLAVWDLAVSNMTLIGWLIGEGVGSWSQHIPALQQQMGVYPYEVFYRGHNEWLQILYENGIVAVAVLGAWIYAHRRMFSGQYGGAVLATLVCSVGMFGFRLAMTGCIAVVILGLATSRRELC